MDRERLEKRSKKKRRGTEIRPEVRGGIRA